MGRIIKILEECYGVKKGNNQHKEESANGTTQKDIAEQLGAKELSNCWSPHNLTQDKLFKLLDIPKEEREDFISKPHEING